MYPPQIRIVHITGLCSPLISCFTKPDLAAPNSPMMSISQNGLTFRRSAAAISPLVRSYDAPFREADSREDAAVAEGTDVDACTDPRGSRRSADAVKHRDLSNHPGIVPTLSLSSSTLLKRLPVRERCFCHAEKPSCRTSGTARSRWSIQWARRTRCLWNRVPCGTAGWPAPPAGSGR